MSNISILKKPVITEKGMQLVNKGQYVFEIDRRANKSGIAKAVARLFLVGVERVRIINRAGKPKRSMRTRRVSHRPDRKFAIVSLKEGHTIKGFEDLLNVEHEHGDQKS